MVISVVGETDKRPVIYTLMRLFQQLGDCALITNDRHLRRLIENGGDVGHFQNIFIAVTDASQDEVFATIGYSKNDFENLIFDCYDQIPEYSDMVIYVGGAGGISEDLQVLLDMQSEYKTINLGFGDKNIPYTKEMFVACEMTEGLKHFVPINPQIASRIATFLTEPLNIPAKDIVKVVMSK